MLELTKGDLSPFVSFNHLRKVNGILIQLYFTDNKKLVCNVLNSK